MTEYLKDNYMSGSGNGPTWHVRIDSCTRSVKSYYEETIEAAKHMYETKRSPLYLLYSGGMDSEYVFNVFLELGFKFTPVIIRLSNYNEHDLLHAFNFCESKGVTPKIVDLDFDNFVTSGKITEIAESIKSCGYEIPATMHVASQLDGFIVLGNDPPYMKYFADSNTWCLEELELIHSILNYFRLHHLEGSPFLLSYSPEMMLSFLLDPTMVSLANNQMPGKQGTNTTKVHVFNNGSGYNIKNRKKYTGYEIIERSEIFNHPNLQKFFEYKKIWGGAHYEPYHDLVERMKWKP